MSVVAIVRDHSQEFIPYASTCYKGTNVVPLDDEAWSPKAEIAKRAYNHATKNGLANQPFFAELGKTPRQRRSTWGKAIEQTWQNHRIGADPVGKDIVRKGIRDTLREQGFVIVSGAHGLRMGTDETLSKNIETSRRARATSIVGANIAGEASGKLYGHGVTVGEEIVLRLGTA